MSTDGGSPGRPRLRWKMPGSTVGVDSLTTVPDYPLSGTRNGLDERALARAGGGGGELVAALEERAPEPDRSASAVVRARDRRASTGLPSLVGSRGPTESRTPSSQIGAGGAPPPHVWAGQSRRMLGGGASR